MKGSARHPTMGGDIVWSVGKLTAVWRFMHTLYYIVSPSTNGFYVGITKNTIEQRFYVHQYAARSGKKTHLYCSMRKHKDFCIVAVDTFLKRSDCCKAEIAHIASAKLLGLNVYNLTSGGEYGFVVDRCLNRESWIAKLKVARKGRTPAKGMKHSEDNKEIFSVCGKARWDKYGRYPDNVTDLPFSEASKVHGISKTHYYRLKRARINEPS